MFAEKSRNNMQYFSIRNASRALCQGLVKPSELLMQAWERIDQTDSEFHAFVRVMREQAYKDAEQVEQEQRGGFFRGPLHGIPIGVKDIIAVKHVPMTAGSKVLQGYIPREDATVVKRLRAARAILGGKTKTHEFACGDCLLPAYNP